MDETIIINGVTYYRKQEAGPDVVRLTERLDWLEQEIRTMLTTAQSLYDQMREDGLTVGTIEAEGYLRAARDMQKWVDYVMEHTK